MPPGVPSTGGAPGPACHAPSRVLLTAMRTDAPSSPSGLHRLHPLTKMALFFVAVVAGASLPTTPLVLGVFVVLLLPLAVWGRCTGAFLRTCAKVIAPFLLSLVLIQGFFTRGPTILFSLGSFDYTLEGLQIALLFTARLLTGLGAATLLMMVTRPDALMRALVARGLPNQIAYIMVTTLQILPTFQARAQAILDAQRSRGLETEGGLATRVRALAPLVSPLIISSLMEIEERAIALEARAFSRPGARTSLVTLHDTRLQSALRWLLLAIAAALVVIRLLGFLRP
jgi:energy-coupling factor transport system permease protein